MSESSRRKTEVSSENQVEYDRLNTVGKAVYITGSIFKVAESVFDFTVSSLSSIWDQAQEAFGEGMDDNVSDAVILNEDENKDNARSS